MNDLISRQAAIDYCYQLINVEHQQGSDEMNYGQERVNQTETILNHLELMPSAQPEPCEDTVSRQRLLSDLKELVAAWNKYPVMAEQIKGVEAAIGYVEAIPSAQSDVPDTNVGDTISRQAAIDVVKGIDSNFVKYIEELPSAQPEPSIPLSWIEGQIEWLRSLDDAFASMTAGQMSAMVEKWKGEQESR